MPAKIAIVGAGLIGCAIAEQLSRRGVCPVVVEAGQVGTQASGRSFGWINASFYIDKVHHHLRRAGMEAWHDLQARLPALDVAWPGCLWWEVQGESLAQKQAEVAALGYPVQRLEGAQLAPHFPPGADLPTSALRFDSEGVAEAGTVTRQLSEVCMQRGVQFLHGCKVEQIETKGGRVTGLKVEGGIIEADQVVVAAGVGTSALCQSVDLPR